MIVLLLIASVATITAATNEETTSHTHINPEYLKPREEYKPILYHPRGEHEIGRYHNNYFGHYAGDYNGHYGNNIYHPYSPYLERKINTELIYGNHIPVQKEPYFIPHNPLQYIPNHKYGYIPAKAAYHNVSPYLERKVDSYAYNQGYGPEGQNHRLYYSHSPAKYPVH